MCVWVLDLINVYKCLKEGRKKTELKSPQWFPLRGNEHKLKYKKFHLNIRKYFCVVRLVK